MKKFKLNVALLCGIMLFTACGQNTEQPADESTRQSTEQTAEESTQEDENTAVEPILSLEEYPKVDGSTANLPLMAEVMSRATGISLEEAEELTSCDMTPQAWYNLAEGTSDLLLVYEPAEATVEKLEEIGTPLTYEAIGNDALVFIVNENNPVDSLTIDQLKGIYKGEITNWSEVGGNDEDIVAFQRSEESGSQSLFIKLLMQGEEPMEAPTELAPGLMGELIDSLAEYNNEGNAIGFSVYYYASYMYTRPGLKFIAVDRVSPRDETIASGEYPFINPFYAAIRTDEPEDSPARKLYNFVIGEEGVKAMKAAGYIPIEK